MTTNQHRIETDESEILIVKTNLANQLGISIQELELLGIKAKQAIQKVTSDKHCYLCLIRPPQFLETIIFKTYQIRNNDKPFDLCLTCYKLTKILIDSGMMKLVGLTSDDRRRELMDEIRKILSNSRRARYR